MKGSLSITNEHIQEAQELSRFAKKQKDALEKIKDDAIEVIQAKTDDGLQALDKKEKNSEQVLQAKTEYGLSALDKKEKKSETVLHAKTEEGLTVINTKLQDSLIALDTKVKNIQTASQDNNEQIKKGKQFTCQ